MSEALTREQVVKMLDDLIIGEETGKLAERLNNHDAAMRSQLEACEKELAVHKQNLEARVTMHSLSMDGLQQQLATVTQEKAEQAESATRQIMQFDQDLLNAQATISALEAEVERERECYDTAVETLDAKIARLEAELEEAKKLIAKESLSATTHFAEVIERGKQLTAARAALLKYEAEHEKKQF